MSSRYEDAVYSLLSDEPMTPSEVAKRLGKPSYLQGAVS
jgi:hypothetical protein